MCLRRDGRLVLSQGKEGKQLLYELFRSSLQSNVELCNLVKSVYWGELWDFLQDVWLQTV
jgi:hypothetical protein